MLRWYGHSLRGCAAWGPWARRGRSRGTHAAVPASHRSYPSAGRPAYTYEANFSELQEGTVAGWPFDGPRAAKDYLMGIQATGQTMQQRWHVAC